MHIPYKKDSIISFLPKSSTCASQQVELRFTRWEARLSLSAIYTHRIVCYLSSNISYEMEKECMDKPKSVYIIIFNGFTALSLCIVAQLLNSVYTRSGQNSTPNSNATNLHSSQKRCCSFCISSSNASPTFQVQKSIFHQMTKPIQVTVILPLLLAISFSRNDDIHSSISGISNDLIGVIPTIGQ